MRGSEPQRPHDVPLRVSIANHVAEITFSRPHALNAINVAMAQAFRDAVSRVTSDRSVRVIVLAGEGRSFMAGGDIAYLRESGADAPASARRLIEPMHEALKHLALSPCPVLAAVQGAVVGAGMSVALGADIVIASDDTRFTFAYSAIGVTPDCGGSWNLVRLVGLRRAMALALMNEPLDAQEALRIGVVNRVVRGADIGSETAKLARHLAAGAPVALGATKALLRSANLQSFAEQLDAEQKSFEHCAGTKDFREALEAFFAKRPPLFTGQ